MFFRCTWPMRERYFRKTSIELFARKREVAGVAEGQTA